MIRDGTILFQQNPKYSYIIQEFLNKTKTTKR